MKKITIIAALTLVSIFAWAADPVPLEVVKPQQITTGELPYTIIPENVVLSDASDGYRLYIGDGEKISGRGIAFLQDLERYVSDRGGYITDSNIRMIGSASITDEGDDASSPRITFSDDGGVIQHFSSISSLAGIFSNSLTLAGVEITAWPAGSDGISADAATNIAETVLAASTNAHDGEARASIVAVGAVASNATTAAQAGQIATNVVGHGLDDYYPVDYATSIAINPTNGYKQGLYLAGTTTVSVAGGATNQMGNVRLDVWTGVNQHLFTNPVPAGTWSTTAVNTVIYSKPAHATAWTARVFQW